MSRFREASGGATLRCDPPQPGTGDRVLIDRDSIRRLLAAQEFPFQGSIYGIALWRCEIVEPGDGDGPVLLLHLTAAPTTPADRLLSFTLRLTREAAVDPAALQAAIQAYLSSLQR